jgi:hypothetical protein
MYFIVVDDKFCNKNFTHQLYVLALAKLLFKRNRLYFSTSDRKYTYMEKNVLVNSTSTKMMTG